MRSGYCKNCGKYFEQHGPGRTQLFCTPACCDEWRHNPDNYSENRMHTYICKNCGKEYETAFKCRDTCCSRECGWQWNHKCGEIRRAMSIDVINCPSCEKVFTGLQGDIFCSEECKEKGYLHSCEICGTEFYGQSNSKYCSDKCARIAIRRSQRQKAKEEGRNSGRVETLVCKYCGKTFKKKVHNGIPEFCSKTCSRAHWREENPDKVAQMKARNRQTRRARKYNNGPVDNITPIDVFNRDKWICGICGQKVNPLLEYPHELSPSLDHIIPLAEGGTHTWDNVQLAHFICNSVKGANTEEAPYEDSLHMLGNITDDNTFIDDH